MKKRLRNNIFYTVSALIVCLAFYIMSRACYLHNVRELPTYKQLTTKRLIHKYDNETLSHLIEKVIEIDGVLKKIHEKDNTYTLYLSHKDNKTYVLCQLQEDEAYKIPHLKIGKKIRVKGILKGHLLDIILLNCIII